MIIDCDLVISPLRICPKKLINMAKNSSEDASRTILNGSKWTLEVDFTLIKHHGWNIYTQITWDDRKMFTE